jgi:phage gpG-like protein
MAELDGFEAMKTALEAIAVRVLGATPQALTRAAHHLEAQVKVELSRTSHPRGTPTPSPPGSPPSLISGTLRRSVQVEGPDQTGAASWSAKVGADTVYAAVQEHGGGNNLPARPYMAPGLATALPAMSAYFEQAWADALS